MDLSIEDQLYEAISHNDLNNVRKTLRKDVNVNSICSSGLTALGAAAHLGNLLICEILIESYHRLQKTNECLTHKNKKLCLSLDNEKQMKNDNKNIGYFVVKKDLDDEIGEGPTPEGMEGLEWDVEIKDTDESSNDESYSSLYQWYADILNRTSDLLKNPLPCDINQVDRYGRTAMHYASDQGHTSIVQLLIAHGSNVNIHTCTSESPLHLASKKGHFDVVALLIKAGARVDHITNSKATPLHLAAFQGHSKVVQMLLQSGANLNSMDSTDRTPLFLAVSQHKARTVELLVRHGAKVNIEDINGNTPLCEAVWTNSISMVQSLISAGAKITQSHYLLHFTVLNNQLEIVKLLVKAGSVINLRDSNGNTPLILAVRGGNADTAKYLLDNGASVNLANSITGSTPLYEAVEFLDDVEITEFKSVVELLLSHGADLEIQSNWETPLYRAIFMEKSLIASALIRYGSNVNFCDLRMNLDSLCVVRKHNNLEIAKMLVYAGYDIGRLDISKFNKTVKFVNTVNDWLSYVKCNPFSLMNLCRIRIRKQLGKKVFYKSNYLGLPKQLVNFLNLEYID